MSDEGDALLYCPSPPSPHSLIVVAADLGSSKFNYSAFAHALSDRGFAVAMLDARFPRWKGGDALAQFRFAAEEYAPAIRRVIVELLKKYESENGNGCNLSGAFAMVGMGRGGESALFAVNQQIKKSEAKASALVLMSMPPIDALHRTTMKEACDELLSDACPALAVPTLVFGTTYLLKPEARVRSSQDFVDDAFTADRAHIDVLDDPTNATLFNETPITGECISRCRRPAWDKGEISRAAVAERIAIWMHAYAEADQRALTTVSAWDRATLVRAVPVEENPEYAKALATQRADDERRLDRAAVLPLLSLPVIIGGTLRPGHNGGGFAIGARPELIVGVIHDRIGEPRGGFGFGGYLSAMTISGKISRETLYGAGGTLVFYTGNFGVAVSGGVDGPSTGGSPLGVIGGFIGFRGDHELGSIDLPFGLRIDGRVGPLEQQSITIAAQIDLMAVVIGAEAFASLATPRD
ncbi:MAG: hypothetical protein ABI183_21460 [Polyangiaceae bacterium]